MEKAFIQENRNCLRVVLYGPESTGKTTLAQQLAEHYQTEWVPEYARDYLQEKYDTTGKICEVEDLHAIAKGQIALENEISQKALKIIFCDTNILQTYFYAQAYYSNFNDPLLKKYAFRHQYDLYFLTYIDTPWEADDLRDKPNERLEMFHHFKNSLEENNIPFVLLKGSKEERLATAIKKTNELLKKNESIRTRNGRFRAD